MKWKQIAFQQNVHSHHPAAFGDCALAFYWLEAHLQYPPYDMSVALTDSAGSRLLTCEALCSVHRW